MKLDKSVVQRRIDLMAAEGIVRDLFFAFATSYSLVFLDFCSRRPCRRRRRC